MSRYSVSITVKNINQLSMTGRTRNQERILTLLQTLNRAISAQDIYVQLRKGSQSIGLATVYRALEALKLEGVVQVRTLASGESLYSSCNKTSTISRAFSVVNRSD
jgi:Fe2+ or Zn2+ uptake regulation protein